MRKLKDDQEYVPPKEEKRKIKRKTLTNTQTWCYFQNLAYANFLNQFKNIFIEEKGRKCHKLFIKMATAIQTRDSNQCKSHHQKMMIRFGSIEMIIEHFQKFPMPAVKNEQQSKEELLPSLIEDIGTQIQQQNLKPLLINLDRQILCHQHSNQMLDYMFRQESVQFINEWDID